MKWKILLSITAISIILVFSISGCKDEPTENKEKVDFCSCINTENIAKSIPIIDEFLSELSENMNDEQKLQELVTWLKSHPCIIDADIICHLCSESEPQISEILISFEENGETKDFEFTISMTNPLKIAGYNEKHYPLDIPFREIVYNSTCFCPWTNIQLGQVIIINSDEELKKYKNCTCGNFPKIDFSKQSLILFDDISPKQYIHIAKTITQLSSKEYKIDVRMPLINKCVGNCRWNIGLLIKKINENSKIEINTIYDEYLVENCDCADELFYYHNGKYFIDNLFINDMLLIGFDHNVKPIEVIEYIYQTGLFSSIIDINHSDCENGYCEEEYNWLIANTKEQKTCSQLKEIIHILNNSSIISFSNFIFESNAIFGNSCGGIMFFTEQFYVEVNDLSDLSDLYNVANETNTIVIGKYSGSGNFLLLSADKKSAGNTLQMANYFYETGLFKSAQPSFTQRLFPKPDQLRKILFLKDINFHNENFIEYPNKN